MTLDFVKLFWCDHTVTLVFCRILWDIRAK